MLLISVLWASIFNYKIGLNNVRALGQVHYN